MKRVILSIFLLVCVACGVNPSPTPPPPPPSASLISITDAALTIRITIDVERGGAIVGLEGDSSGNLVDIGDLTGRAIQASLYDGHWGPDCWPCRSSCTWGTNPAQAGNACQIISGGSVLEQSATSITTVTTPQEWNDAHGRSKVTLQQTVKLIGPGLARIDYQVTNHYSHNIGTDNWHELPVAYLTSAFTHGVTARGQTTTTSMINFRDGSDWIALSRDDGWTVALVAPGDHLWSIGFGGDTKPTAWMQGWQWLQLAPEETGTATAWLVVGQTLGIVTTRMSAIGS